MVANLFMSHFSPFELVYGLRSSQRVFFVAQTSLMSHISFLPSSSPLSTSKRSIPAPYLEGIAQIQSTSRIFLPAFSSQA